MMLPKLIFLEEYKGDIDRYLEAIYQVYLSEVVKLNLIFLDLPIRYQYHPPTKNMHFSFWHLISEGEKEEERLINFRRCERIRWVSFVLRNAHDLNLIHCWQNERHGNKHIVLWLHQHDFVVILAKRKGYLLLKTAYPIEKKHRIKKLQLESEKFIDPRKG